MEPIRLLYVEDEPALARITADTLRKNHFQVTHAVDGVHAFEIFTTNTFDICIVDIMLPKLDGYALVKKIRELNTMIPVIFLTARTMTEDIVKGFNTGGNDYLKKPFSIEELIVRINELVRRTAIKTDTTAPVPAGTYQFNYHKMELSHSQETIALTHRENELIKRLLANRNEVLDTRQVLLELWGDDSFYNARSLNVFITKIRKYLRHDPSISIVNVRAVGYKLIV